MDEDRLIGRRDVLPWNLPEEMEHFRRTTLGSVVIFGRATWESMASDPPYLDGRINFVVTRKPSDWQAKLADAGFDPTYGPHFVDTIELAVTRAKRDFPEYVENIFLLGGRQIYELALRKNLVTRMLISHVKGKHIGDVYFPQFGPEWAGKTISTSETFDVVEYTKGSS